MRQLALLVLTSLFVAPLVVGQEPTNQPQAAAPGPQEGSNLLKSMTIGGLTGAIAGVLAALWRRNLRRKAADERQRAS